MLNSYNTWSNFINQYQQLSFQHQEQTHIKQNYALIFLILLLLLCLRQLLLLIHLYLLRLLPFRANDDGGDGDYVTSEVFHFFSISCAFYVLQVFFHHLHYQHDDASFYDLKFCVPLCVLDFLFRHLSCDYLLHHDLPHEHVLHQGFLFSIRIY